MHKRRKVQGFDLRFSRNTASRAEKNVQFASTGGCISDKVPCITDKSKYNAIHPQFQFHKNYTILWRHFRGHSEIDLHLEQVHISLIL